MSTVDDLIEAFQKVNVREVVTDVIIDSEKEILDANREQLLHGQGSDGKLLKRYKSSYYARLKNFMNALPPYGVADLRFTGDYHDSFKMDVAGINILIYATDYKAAWLEKRDKNIYGLDDVSAAELEEETITPRIVDRLKDKVGL